MEIPRPDHEVNPIKEHSTVADDETDNKHVPTPPRPILAFSDVDMRLNAGSQATNMWIDQ